MSNNQAKLIIKSVKNRTFTGYISVEDVDSDGDIVPIEPLAEAMKPYLKTGGQLQLTHSNVPVGNLTEAFLGTEPDTGKPALIVHGKIHNDGRSIFDKVWDRFTNGEVGFSIGGLPLKYHDVIINGETVRSLDEIELYEVSVVCSIDGKQHIPANRHAKLLGLGHLAGANNAIPITVKMVLNKMPNEDEKKDEKTDTEEKETTEDETEDEVDDVAKSITDSVEKEALDMVGGTAAITALTEANQKVSDLTKSHIAVSNKLEISMKEKSQLEAKIIALEKEIATANIKADAWKEMFRKNTSDKDAISRMIAEGRTIVNQGVMPHGQSQPIVTKENNSKSDYNLVEKFAKTKNTANYSDEEFLKVVKAANRIGGN